jgi:LmbE family N-acetylglucosaminyl deacetylase
VKRFTLPGWWRLRALRIVYVVVPHPDDEFEAWALLQDRAGAYPVFVLCTHGERTVAADGRAHQPELGEWTPQPQPWAGPGSATVRAQRIASFHAFLDAMADVDRHLDRDLDDHGELADGPSAFRLHVGARSARVVFDGGDGRLTPAFVTAAVQRTRALRFTHLPVQDEDFVVGAAYVSAVPGSVRYTHPDHRAVHAALWETDQGVPGPQWCRTATADPDVVRTGGRTERVTAPTYDAVMGIAPDGRRTGLLQVFYGWLGPPGGWPAGETDAETMWSRQQSFWRRFG